MPRFTKEDPVLDAENKAYLEERYNNLKKLLQIVGVENSLKLNIKATKESVEGDTNIVFFKFVPDQLPPEVIDELLASMESLIRYSIESSDVHQHLTPPQKDLQIERHKAMGMLMKMTREENPHHCWVAINTTKKRIKVEGCVFLDPEVVKFTGKTTIVFDDQELDVEIDEEGVEIKSLFVSPEMQRQGLASHLVDMVKFFNYSHIRNNLIALVPYGPLAQAFFTSPDIGFVPVGVTETVVKSSNGEIDGKPIVFLFYLMLYSFAQLLDDNGMRDFPAE
jgi:ribosomal protein S18 acetylase RimI-like enzyme